MAQAQHRPTTSQPAPPPAPGAPLRIGLAGIGTVGGGVIRLLDQNAGLIARRAGRPLQVVAVSARNRTLDRGLDLSRFAWEDDPGALARRPDVDVVVELMGGSDGPALTLARATLAAGKPLVTANKAMIAHHGLELAATAEAARLALKFEAAVAGGIPVVKGVREGTAANRVHRVIGILNGTCNYILTRMEKEGLEFADVLADAQRLGYAEADPTFDIDGIDTAHKLAILATLAFGSKPAFADVETAGIRGVRLADIRQAGAFGYKVRLIGLAEMVDGKLSQRVQPTLVPDSHPLAAVEGPLNAVVVDGDFVASLLFMGSGAGAGPTASAVVADLIDIARGENGPAFAMPAAALDALAPAGPGLREGNAYLRLVVADRPGVLAEITAALAAARVSIERLIQPSPAGDGTALVVIQTHRTSERAVQAALQQMTALPITTDDSLFMPILKQHG